MKSIAIITPRLTCMSAVAAARGESRATPTPTPTLSRLLTAADLEHVAGNGSVLEWLCSTPPRAASAS